MTKRPQKKGIASASKRRSSSRDQFTVVLEDMRAHFQAFSESLAVTRESLERKVDGIYGEIAKLHIRIAGIEKEIVLTAERISRLEQANLELLKEIREHTVGRKEFDELREEVRRLKATLAAR